MRRGGAWAAVLVCVAAAGCLTRPDGPAGPSRTPRDAVSARGRSFGMSPFTEGLYVESVLLERPIGDSLLDRDLWAADSAQLPAATKVLLTENGLRAAVIGGNLPPAFQRLLASESETVNPHGLTFGSRKDAVLPTAGPTDPCEYEVLTDLAGERVAVALHQARGGVLVRPEAAADGRVKVWCEPQVQHGDRQEYVRPNPDGTGLRIEGEVPLERYPGLGFEVVLGSGDYLVIGSPAGAAGTLGAALFGVEAKGRPRQRVLVVRAGNRGDATTDQPAVRGRTPIAAEAARW